MNLFNKAYRPSPFVPTTSFTGREDSLVISGKNMWLRFGRFNSSVYGEGYTGNLSLNENIPTKTLTGTLAWTNGSATITGTSTSFIEELHLGCFVLADGGSGATELFVVERIVSDTSFICSRPPTASATGKTGYIMPVIFPLGTQRGTLVRGNALQFPKGLILGVGAGELRINGSTLSSSFTASRTPRFAIYDASTNTYTQSDVGLSKPTVPITLSDVTALVITGATSASPIEITCVGHGLSTGNKVNIGRVLGVPEANGTFIITSTGVNTFTLNGTTGTGAYVSGGSVFPSPMRAGAYNVRICAYRSGTLGYSQPSDVLEPITLTDGQSIKITFNSAMASNQDGYLIFATPFTDNSTSTIEARYMGAWYLVKTITAEDLIDGSHATGRETGTSYVFSYSDAEIQTSTQILTFNNFTPKKAEFVDLINGIPLYFSCLGKGNTTDKNGTSPGAVCIPSKPSNPEAVFLNKAITTAGGDYIIGEFNAKSRIYVLCQNTLQTLILTTLDEEPITFRSLWNSGFRNPYNVAFVKEYLYGFSTQRIVRSVAGGDDSAMEFEFTSDVRDYIKNWECGHVLTAYDPKNRAVCFFYSATERQSGYWVTYCLPFLLDKQVWNPPIILKKANQDFIVSGVANIGEHLEFLAGGRKSDGTISVDTYRFDGGDSETKDWYLAWAYSDDGAELNPKTIKGVTVTGRFANATSLKLYGIRNDGAFDLANLATGSSPTHSKTISANTNRGRKRLESLDWGGFSLYAIGYAGSYTTTADILDELVLEVEVNNSKQ